MFGPIPAETDWIDTGLSPVFKRRWQALTKDVIGKPITDDDRRIWRFIAAPGIFERTPSAGVWRVSQDRSGKTGPLVLAMPDAAPEQADPWFEAASELAQTAAEGFAGAERVINSLHSLRSIATNSPPSEGAIFWIDDWEVHELYYPDIHALATGALADMNMRRPTASAEC